MKICKLVSCTIRSVRWDADAKKNHHAFPTRQKSPSGNLMAVGSNTWQCLTCWVARYARTGYTTLHCNRSFWSNQPDHRFFTNTKVSNELADCIINLCVYLPTIFRGMKAICFETECSRPRKILIKNIHARTFRHVTPELFAWMCERCRSVFKFVSYLSGCNL